MDDDDFSESQHGPNGEIHFTVRKPLEILKLEFDPADAILENGYLEKGCPSVWCGIGGLGKSRLLLQLAVKSALGYPFIGWQTHGENLRWLILQTENGNKRLQADLAAMLANLTSIELQTINNAITIHTIENDDDGFMFLSNEKVVAGIQSLINDATPNIVVFDPLRDFAIGDLNSDADMAQTLAKITRLTRNGNPKRTALVLHHSGTGKAGIAKAVGFDRSSFGRNSKVLIGWTRSQINLAPYEPNSNDVIVVSSGKCNNAAEFEPFAIRLNTTIMTYELADDVNLDAWEESINSNSPAKRKAKDFSTDDALALAPQLDKMLKAGLVDKINGKGVGIGRAKLLVNQLLDEAKLFEHRVKRTQKRDAIYVARFAPTSE
jgi:AAA domain